MEQKRGLAFKTSFYATWGLSLVVLLASALPNLALAEAPQCRAIFAVEDVLSAPMQTLDKTFHYGSKDYGPAVSLARTINDLPPEQKENWIRAIGRIYRQIPKKNPSPTAPRLLGGRRLLDRLLSAVENYNIKFKESADKGLAGKEIYQAFLNRQQEIFGIQYGQAEISQLIEVVQVQLKKRDATNGMKSKVLLAGSFINGKGSLTDSDIDLSVNDASPEWIRETMSWAAPINDSLRAAYPKANLTIETHGEPAVFYGKLNPIVLEVTADKVEILVFPPGKGNGEWDLRADEPTRYSF